MRTLFQTKTPARPNTAVPAPALLLLAVTAAIMLILAGCELGAPADFLRDKLAVVTVKEVQARQHAAVTENGVNIGPSTAQIALMLDNNRKIPLRLGLNRPNPDDGHIDWTFKQISAGEVLVTINGFALGDDEQNLILFMGADGRDFEPFNCTLRCTTVIGTTPYTVTFIDNDHGTVTPLQTVYDGSLLGYPDATAPAGYYVEGWYRDSDCTNRWDFVNDIVTGDTTLWAKWAAIGGTTYDVTFIDNVYSTDTALQTVVAGGYVVRPIPPATVPGYTIAEWFTDTGIPWNFAAGTVTGDITLYAQWQQAYTITFDMQGHGTPLAPQIVVGSGAGTDPGDPTEAGWNFRGWYTGINWSSSSKWGFGTSLGDAITGDTILYAKWVSQDDEDDFGEGKIPDTTRNISTGGTGGNELYYYLKSIESLAGNHVINLSGGNTHDFAGAINLAAGVKISLRGADTIRYDGTPTGPLFGINGGGASLSIRGPTLQGFNGNTNSLVVVTSGEFYLHSGAIQNNIIGVSGGGGGVRVDSGGTFTMTGGTISGNTAISSGGGVFVTGSSTFTMNDGTISGNTTGGDGGGVYVNNGTFTMNGGTISGNTAATDGGGVCVSSSGGRFIKTPASGSSTGGTITGTGDPYPNRATGGNGAAVYDLNGTRYRDSTAGEGDDVDTNDTANTQGFWRP